MYIRVNLEWDGSGWRVSIRNKNVWLLIAKNVEIQKERCFPQKVQETQILQKEAKIALKSGAL